jgi:ACS family tartrate transporter-like MFS transporter
MFLTGSAAAAGIGLISAIGNLGGFVGPYAVGWARDATGSYAAGLYLLAGCAVAGALVAALIDTPSHLPDEAQEKPA